MFDGILPCIMKWVFVEGLNMTVQMKSFLQQQLVIYSLLKNYENYNRLNVACQKQGCFFI